MNKSSFVVGLLGIYASVLSVSILLYVLVETYNLDVTLFTNLLVWSATIFAPIAVIYSLKFWKIQNQEEERIKKLKDLKVILTDIFMLIDDFRSRSNAVFDIQNKKTHILKEKIRVFSGEYRSLIAKFHYELVSREEFFTKSEVDFLIKKLHKTENIIYALDQAFLIVETHMLSIQRTGLLSGVKLEYEKNLYILSPYSWVFRVPPENIANLSIYDEFESEVFDPINQLSDYVGQLIRRSFE